MKLVKHFVFDDRALPGSVFGSHLTTLLRMHCSVYLFFLLLIICFKFHSKFNGGLCECHKRITISTTKQHFMRKYSGKNERKIYLYNLYTIKITSTIGTVIYSLINKQFLRLKIFNNFLRDKQQYFSFFFYIALVYFM